MPGDLRSKPRYFLTVAVVVAGCMWWMGPMIGVFVVDPMIQLTLSNFQVGVLVAALACTAAAALLA